MRPSRLGIAIGVAADQLVGDPRRGHPVALFGSAAGRLEGMLYADSRARGLVFVAATVGPTVLLGRLLPHRTTTAAIAIWAVLGGHSLAAEARAVEARLGDLPRARRRLTHLVGRDTSDLDEAGISRAVIESVAENTCDAVVAPLLWGAVFGVPGLLGYRAVNTLDAMVGHRSPRYEHFGWAAARFDDIANLVPSRITALLTAAVAPLVDGSPRATLRAARRWGSAHPSPNSGYSEAAAAGALGLRLGGRNVYDGRVDDRPVLGDGAVPRREDIARAVLLLHAVTLAAAAVAVAVAGR